MNGCGLRPSFVLLVVFALASCTDAHDVDALSVATVGAPDGGLAGDEGAGSSAVDGDRGQTGGPPGVDGGPDPSAPAGGSSGGSGGSGSVPPPPPPRPPPSGVPFPGSGGGNNPSSGGSGGSADLSECSPCSGAMGAAGALEACCTDAGECGVDLGMLTGSPACLQQNAPGMLDTSCPELDVMGMFQIPGCCMPSGECGVMIRMLAPLGCVDPDDLGGFLGGGGGGRPTRCGGRGR